MEYSQLVKDYRAELDSCGIAWKDNSQQLDVYPHIRFERTQTELGGNKVVSVIYSFAEDNPSIGYSYDYPDKLEVWVIGDKENDPVPMTIPEIMEKYFHVKED